MRTIPNEFDQAKHDLCQRWRPGPDGRARAQTLLTKAEQIMAATSLAEEGRRLSSQRGIMVVTAQGKITQAGVLGWREGVDPWVTPDEEARGRIALRAARAEVVHQCRVGDGGLVNFARVAGTLLRAGRGFRAEFVLGKCVLLIWQKKVDQPPQTA